ncbi:bestrophin family protein [Nannocystaceae bacterium ST9]
MIDYDPKAWLRIVVTLRGAVAPRLIVRVSIAIALGLVAWWAHVTAEVAIPPLAHTLIGAALGLLLVFRTNASYGRYVEARELLGRIVNASRDLARQVVIYVDDHPERAALRADVLRWIGAFYRLLVQNVRDERELGELGERLSASERALLEPLRHRPSVVATWIGVRLHAAHRAGHLEIEPLRAMDANLTVLVASLGGCERIRRTPVPFAYAQHIKLFMVLFCYTVPFAIVEALGVYTPIASGVLSFALFGIDEIGVEIEDPFGSDPNDLPMERIGDTVDLSTREIVEAGER